MRFMPEKDRTVQDLLIRRINECMGIFKKQEFFEDFGFTVFKSLIMCTADIGKNPQ